jgi:hypothetical protein
MSTQGDRLCAMAFELRRFHPRADDRDKNHQHYFAEASQFLRTAREPLDLLRFVDRLLRSPFASRPQQRQALVDVGEWIFARLLREPSLDRDTLAWELGWMRRLVTIRNAEGAARASTAPHASRGRAPKTEVPDFQRKIEAVERRRSEQQQGSLLRNVPRQRHPWRPRCCPRPSR